MKAKKIRRTVLIAVSAALCLWIFFRFLFGILLPFFIALAIAALVEKPVTFLREKAGIPRGAASFFCVLLILAALGAAIFFLCRGVLSELTRFLRELPSLAEGIAGPLQRLEEKLFSLADRLPDGIGSGLHAGLERFFASGAGLGAKLYEWLFSFASGFLTKLPATVLFLVTTILASFMFCCELPKLRRWLQKKLPSIWREHICTVGERLKSSLGAWLKAQLKLMGVTFLIVTLGLMLLGVDFPLLMSLLITLVDALPVFGTGTILLPWAALMFLRGKTRIGVGFTVLYAVAALTRQTLEPRLVGKGLGLNPLFTLAALYTGFRVMGVGGLILFPIAAIFIKQLWDHADFGGFPGRHESA